MILCFFAYCWRTKVFFSPSGLHFNTKQSNFTFSCESKVVRVFIYTNSPTSIRRVTKNNWHFLSIIFGFQAQIHIISVSSTFQPFPLTQFQTSKLDYKLTPWIGCCNCSHYDSKLWYLLMKKDMSFSSFFMGKSHGGKKNHHTKDKSFNKSYVKKMFCYSFVCFISDVIGITSLAHGCTAGLTLLLYTTFV